MTTNLLNQFQDSVLVVDVRTGTNDTFYTSQELKLNPDQLADFQLPTKYQNGTAMENLQVGINAIVSTLESIRSTNSQSNAIGMELAKLTAATFHLQQPADRRIVNHPPTVTWKIIPIHEGTWVDSNGNIGYTTKLAKQVEISTKKKKSIGVVQTLPKEEITHRRHSPVSRYTVLSAGTFGLEEDLLLPQMAEPLPPKQRIANPARR